jgi:hypothetical protein
MKKVFILSIILAFGINLVAQESDKEAIKKLVLTAYIDGLQNKGDLNATEKGFYPGFNLLMLRNNMVDKLPIYNWLKYAEMKKEKDPEPYTKEELTSCEFEFIDITGTAAVTKIHLSKGGKKIYTDYLSLYKFEDGWKVVSKIYYKIPE